MTPDAQRSPFLLIALFCFVCSFWQNFTGVSARGMSAKQPPLEKARVERNAPPDYYIDVLVVLDFAFIQNWRVQETNVSASEAEHRVKEYMTYLFQGIDKRFSSLHDLPFRLHVSISDVIIAKTAEDSPWTESVKNVTGSGRATVKADRVLIQLEDYVRTNYSSLPLHDHFMLFTGYDLFGEDKFTAGLADTGTVCRRDGRSVSVVEDDGAYQTEATAAHELAHSLGALHDGTNNSCSAADRYIMSPGGGDPKVTDSNQLNPWTFSPCSLRAFKQHLSDIDQGLAETCLLKQEEQMAVPPAALYAFPAHPDEQCRYIYGPASYLCREFDEQADDICLKMACFNPSQGSTVCTQQPAATGTCCGSGKWCQGGRCVSGSPRNQCANISAVCPFGQQPGALKQKGGGAQLCTQLSAQQCYVPEVRRKCCQRCQEVHTAVTDCPYGDRVGGCNVTVCRLHTPDAGRSQVDRDCCGTCNYTSAPCSDSNKAWNVTLQGRDRDDIILIGTCPQLMASPQLMLLSVPQGRQLCCDAGFKQRCCRTCLERQGSEECPFGDCTSECSKLLNRTYACSQHERQQCCHTCSLIHATITPTTTTTTTTATTTSGSTTTKRLTTRAPVSTKTCREVEGVGVVCSDGHQTRPSHMVGWFSMVFVFLLATGC